MKYIFQDIDGPLIPLRMYYHNNQRPFDHNVGSFIYDPVAIGMLNELCEKLGAQVVFNSMHNENGPAAMTHQGRANGLRFLHEDSITPFPYSAKTRIDGIHQWLKAHGEEDATWIVIDDMHVDDTHQVFVDFNVGMSAKNFLQAWEKLGGKPFTLTGV